MTLGTQFLKFALTKRHKYKDLIILGLSSILSLMPSLCSIFRTDYSQQLSKHSWGYYIFFSYFSDFFEQIQNVINDFRRSVFTLNFTFDYVPVKLQ